MREIKFRAWSDFEELMSHDVTLYANGWYGVVFPNGNEAKYAPNFGLKIMQFTGLQDKNGREIYEGDIYHQGDPKITYTVVWADTGLKGKQNGSSSYAGLSHWEDRIEIIGNIHEHPHLLERSVEE